MNSNVRRPIIGLLACAIAVCASNNLVAKTSPAGTRFNEKGKVILHRGQPCTSQIMFDFHPIDSRAVVWLAAGAHDSMKLTEMARSRGRVQITGVWRRGRQTECAYVDVKKVTIETSWWNKLFKP